MDTRVKPRMTTEYVEPYGVAIPIFFSAASIRCGGSIFITALRRLQQALQAGEDRGPALTAAERMSPSIGRSCAWVSVSRTASPARSIS